MLGQQPLPVLHLEADVVQYLVPVTNVGGEGRDLLPLFPVGEPDGLLLIALGAFQVMHQQVAALGSVEVSVRGESGRRLYWPAGRRTGRSCSGGNSS